MGFDGLFVDRSTLALLSNAKSRSLSAENPRGEAGMGGRAEHGTGERAARELGVGWKVSPCISIEPNAVATLADLDGPGAIQSMWITGSVSRDLILRVYWDHQEQPSVECPLPDFFGCGWFSDAKAATVGGFPQLNSSMIAVNPRRGMNCFWPMPFRRHCRITMENRADAGRTCFYQINYVLADVPEDAAYFHAQFRRVQILPYAQDYTILDGIRGRGHYVGTALSVGLNGGGNWWGEGEVKFFLDDDSDFPTICGTGTEDYFLGAYDWDVDGNYVPHNSLYGGMFYVEKPDGLYRSQQRFSMYRWHVPDPVRFEKSLRLTLQDLGWRSGGRYLVRQDDFASTAYWYQTLPTAPFPTLPLPGEMEII